MQDLVHPQQRGGFNPLRKEALIMLERKLTLVNLGITMVITVVYYLLWTVAKSVRTTFETMVNTNHS